MASANNVFSCCDIFLRPSERRNVFSSSGEFVLPTLKQVVADVSGKADKLPDVFLLQIRSYVVHGIGGLRL